jgi:sugar transferase (PEP-CTERM/EpsH1 system associated)
MWPQVASRSTGIARAARANTPARTHVAQVVRSLDTGGQEVMVARLVERLDPAHFRSTVISLQGGGWLADQLASRGMSVLCLNAPEAWSPATIGRVAEILRRERVDVVHCHNRKAVLYGGLATFLAPHSRLVYTKHGASHWDGGPTALLGRLVMRRSRAIVAVSQDIERGVLDGNWADRNRLHTVLNGVDLTQFHARTDRASVRQAVGIPPQARVVGTVARLSPEKDQASLLAAFAKVAPAMPEARLVLVGGGPLRAALEAQARELRITERTHFLGERQDVAELLGAMDVFCLPSLTEGTSLTLLEAMATGLPVVATSVGGTPEVVAAGASGLLVEPGRPDLLADALQQVLHSESLAARFGEAGREIVRARYSMQSMVERYAGIYQRVLS